MIYCTYIVIKTIKESNNPGWAIFSFGISHASPQEELRRVSNLTFLIDQFLTVHHVNQRCRNILKSIQRKISFLNDGESFFIHSDSGTGMTSRYPDQIGPGYT